MNKFSIQDAINKVERELKTNTCPICQHRLKITLAELNNQLDGMEG